MEYKNSFVCYESVYRQFERMVQRGKQETATAKDNPCQRAKNKAENKDTGRNAGRSRYVGGR